MTYFVNATLSTIVLRAETGNTAAYYELAFEPRVVTGVDDAALAAFQANPAANSFFSPDAAGNVQLVQVTP